MPAIVLARLQPPQELLVAVADHELSPPLFSPPIQTDWKLSGAVCELMEPQANLQLGKGFLKVLAQLVAAPVLVPLPVINKRMPMINQGVE
jgi:hypothetical protein